MTITRETLRAVLELRGVVDQHVDQSTTRLARSWLRMWNELSRDWTQAIQEILATGSTGRLTHNQLFRLTRVQAALGVSLQALDQLAVEAEQILTDRIPALVGDASAHELAIITAQLPDPMQTPDVLDRLPARAMREITRRATEQVTSLTRPLADDAYRVMLSELQRGVALGVNPRVAAARMLQRTRGGFDGGLARATRIARTEMLDAYREAARATDAVNADVLTGWKWSASLSPKTCPACLAMNGRVFPLSTPGPQGHVNCRCARVPVTKTWAQLGFVGMPEPKDRLPDAETWFNNLSESQQLAIMGPTRLRLLRSGAVSWSDLAVKVPNSGWRPSWQPRTLTDLRSRATQTA